MHTKRWLIFGLWLCWAPASLAAAPPEGIGAVADGPGWKHLNTTSGLTGNFVTALAADRSAIYVGTKSGLTQFDKKSETCTGFSVAQGLPHEHIFSLLTDGGKLWIGTQKGLAVLADGKISAPVGYDALSQLRINAIVKKEDTLFLGTQDGMFQYSPATGVLAAFGSLQGQNITNLRIDETGILVSLLSGSVSFYDLTQSKLHPIELKLNPLKHNVMAVGIGGDCIWFATDGSGVIEYNKIKKSWDPLCRTSDIDRFQSAMAEDGNFVWFGTFYGLYRYNQKKHLWETFNEELLTENSLTALLVDGSEIWVGTDGSGLLHGNKKYPALHTCTPKRFYADGKASLSAEARGSGPLTVKIDYANSTFPDLWLSQYTVATLTADTGEIHAELDLPRLADDLYQIRITVTDAERHENSETTSVMKSTKPPALTFANHNFREGKNRISGAFTGAGIDQIILKPGDIHLVLDRAAKTFTGEIVLSLNDRQLAAEITDVTGQTQTIAQQIQVNPLPKISVSAEPNPFVPETDQVKFNITESNTGEVTAWELNIYTEEDIPVFKFSGEQELPTLLLWDGKDLDSNWVDGGARFYYLMKIRDRDGLETSTPKQPLTSNLVVKKKFRQTTIKLSNAFLFDPGKAEIRPEASVLFEELAPLIREHPQQMILVEGYSDDTPIHNYKFPSNLQLSEARALNVVSRLIANGLITPSHISAVGYGSDRPVASNKTERGKAKNRRVEIVLMEPISQEAVPPAVQ